MIFIYLKTPHCYFNPQLALRLRNPFRSCYLVPSHYPICCLIEAVEFSISYDWQRSWIWKKVGDFRHIFVAFSGCMNFKTIVSYKVIYRSRTRSHFMEQNMRFGLTLGWSIGNTEIFFFANYEQLLRPTFHVFMDKRKC